MKKLLLHTIFCVLLCYFGFSQETKNAQVDIYATEDKDALQIFDPNGDVKFVVTPNGAVYLKGIDLTNIAPVQGMIALNSLTGRLMTYDEGSWKNLIQEVPVKAINGQTGMVSIDYKDVGAEQAFEKNEAFNKVFGTTKGTVKEGSWRPTWDEVLEKPSKFPPSAHTHSDYVSLENGFDVNTGGKLSSISGSISHQSNSENNYGGLLPSSFGSSWLFNSDIGRDFAFYKDAKSEDMFIGFDNPTSGQFEFKKLLHEDNLEIAKPTWNDIIKKPTTFNPSVHQHDASEISSGIFSYDRLPFNGTNVSNWNQAYQAYTWGNHANAGYLHNTTDQLTGDLTVTNNVITPALSSPTRNMVVESGTNLNVGDYNGGTTSVSLRAKNDPTFYNGSLHTIWHSGNFIKGNYLRRNINDTFSGQFMRFDHSSNHGIVTGSDSQRLLIGGGSNWNGNNGAYISLEGNNYGGAGAGKDIHLLPGSGGGIVNVGTSLTVNSNITANTITAKGGGNNIRLNGSGTGLSNVAYASFYESNGSNRQGYIGFPSASSGHLILHNDLGSNQIILNQNGGENGFQYYQGSNTRTVYHSGNHMSDADIAKEYFPRNINVASSDANKFITDGYVNARPWAANAPPIAHGTTFGFGEKASGFRQIHISDAGDIAVRGLKYDNTAWSDWNTLWHDGNLRSNSQNDARYYTKGQSDNNYIKRNNRTDGGYAWIRRNSGSSTSSPFYVTEQGAGVIAAFYQGSGDGTRKSEISNDGSYRMQGGGNIDIYNGGAIRRFSHSSGYLEGSYNSVGANGSNTNPIYIIGSNYKPTNTALNNMYGIGYAQGGSASFLNSTELGRTPSNGWGMYLAAAGNARIFLDASNGNGYFRGGIYADRGVFRGNITASGNITGSNLSGTNTGDQTLSGLGGVPTSRAINTGLHLSGGGNLSANRTLTVKPTVNQWIVDSQGKQRMYFYSNNNGGVLLRASAAGGKLEYRDQNNNTRWSVDTNGTVRASGDVIAGSASDKRLKDDIEPIRNPIEKILKLSGNSYKWNDKQTAYKTGTKDYGVIAQEVKEVLPNAVKLRETTGYYEVDYKDLIPLLIEAVKAQQKEIKTLKALNEEYEKGKIKEFEAELEMIKKKLGL